MKTTASSRSFFPSIRAFQSALFSVFSSILLLSILLLSISSSVYGECTLRMTYKEGAKEPLISRKPDNSGIYYELFETAAQRIGCSLEVQRLPKKRLHGLLAKGEVDFYPGASFSNKRSKYLYYIPNGMDTGEYGVTNMSVPEIGRYEDLKQHKITWLMEIGSSKAELAHTLGIATNTRSHQDLDLVSKFIQRSPGNNYFYVADKELIDFFPKKSGLSSITEAGLKVHKNCCGGEQPMYMGFSRLSPHYRETKNPNYDDRKPVSPSNFPTIVDKGTIAYRLGRELEKMKTEGMTQTIHKRWFFDK